MQMQQMQEGAQQMGQVVQQNYEQIGNLTEYVGQQAQAEIEQGEGEDV